jgi:hypothetical protein
MLGVAGAVATAVLGQPVPTVAAEPLAPTVDFDKLLDSIGAPSAAEEDLSAATEVMELLPDQSVANAWVDPSSDQLTVGVTSGSSAAAITDALEAKGIDDAVVEVVDDSQAELDRIVEGVYELPGMESISSAMHDYASNRVILTSRTPVSDALRQRAYEYFGDTVAIASEPEEAASMSRDADTSPFNAGASFGKLHGEVVCTAGWSWLTPSGLARMLTAGHCLPIGSSYPMATNAVPLHEYLMGNPGASTFETGTGTVGADGDLAMINLASADRSATPQMWTLGPTSTTSTTVNSVDFWTSNGTDVCYSGRRRGVQCGTEIDSDGNGGFNVDDKDASYTDKDTGEVYTHVAYSTKGWGKCSQNTESGSPVYINTPGTGVAAHGILSGGGGGGSDQFVGKFEPGHCVMWFTEIGQAYEHWSGHVETIYG